MGIFITPMIAGHEPKYQKHLSIALFGALVLVVVGSLLGEAASLKGFITSKGPWFWIGSQGWEYLDLGRLWQILLTIGMFFWVIILIRGMAGRLKRRASGQYALSVFIQCVIDSAFLCRRNGIWKGS